MYNKINDIIQSIEFILTQKKIDFNIFFKDEINLILLEKQSSNLDLIEEIKSISKQKIVIIFAKI